MNIIYKCRAGSHAYGMNTPTSDEDFAGIFIPDIEFFFGLKAFDQQIDQSKEVDTTLYSLRKYATLAIANNPNVMELMFVDKSLPDSRIRLRWKNCCLIRDAFPVAASVRRRT
jgi:predicted nucleotidyltransferase